jgi:hypothetical protein
MVDGVSAGASDTYDLDNGTSGGAFYDFKHACLLPGKMEIHTHACLLQPGTPVKLAVLHF